MIRRALAALRSLAGNGRPAGLPAPAPWSPVDLTPYLEQIRADIADLTARTATPAELFEECCDGMDADALNPDDVHTERVLDAANTWMHHYPALPEAWLLLEPQDVDR